MFKVYVGNESLKMFDTLLSVFTEQNTYIIDDSNISIAHKTTMNFKQTYTILIYDTIKNKDKKNIRIIIDNILRRNKDIIIFSISTDKVLYEIIKEYKPEYNQVGIIKNDYDYFVALREDKTIERHKQFLDNCVMRLVLPWSYNDVIELSSNNLRQINEEVNHSIEKGSRTDKYIKSYMYYSFPNNTQVLPTVYRTKNKKQDSPSGIIHTVCNTYQCSKKRATELYNFYCKLKKLNSKIYIKIFEEKEQTNFGGEYNELKIEDVVVDIKQSGLGKW